MRIKDMKIGSQLRIGLSIIVLFVLILGLVAKLHTEKIWAQSDTLYRHPLQVRRAAGDLQADILTIHRCMKDVALSRSDAELNALQQQMAVCEADAARQFSVLTERYLGPKSDVISLQNDFGAWKAVREETIRLIRVGQRDKAVQRIRAEGVGGQIAKKCIDHLNDISNFAGTKADELYTSAVYTLKVLHTQLIVIVVVIILMSGAISWWLMHAIKSPLVELTGITEAFRQGLRHVRSEYTANNEFGVLARSFNSLADTV